MGQLGSPGIAGFDPVTFVREYIELAQRTRMSQSAEDLAALRTFLAPDLTIKMASPWTDSPWRVVSTSSDELLKRLTDPINRGSSLTTETVNVVRAGDDVLVEQISAIARDGRDHVSTVCHIFSVQDGLISAIRAYRNDLGIPPG
jgi:ketosteroid isomerase-like protein